MERKDFITAGLVSSTLLSSPFATVFNSYKQENEDIQQVEKNGVTIERPEDGQPYKDKVLAAIQPHNDDIPIFAGGTVAKLLDEGYTGYLIRTSNDDAAGRGDSIGERVLNNEKANGMVAKVFGMEKVYDLEYRNHRMDQINIQDLKSRLIFLFRLLQVDTVISYDPWGDYEENPDHYVTAKAVEAACWMAGRKTDYPEQLDLIGPYTVTRKYYFARGPQRVNRVVDIGKFIDTKIKSNQVNTAQGPGGNSGWKLRNKLKKEGKKLPFLGNEKEEANYNYIKKFVLDRDKKFGEKYGLEWGEPFHYIASDKSKVKKYIENNAVSI